MGEARVFCAAFHDGSLKGINAHFLAWEKVICAAHTTRKGTKRRDEKRVSGSFAPFISPPPFSGAGSLSGKNWTLRFLDDRDVLSESFGRRWRRIPVRGEKHSRGQRKWVSCAARPPPSPHPRPTFHSKLLARVLLLDDWRPRLVLPRLVDQQDKLIYL